MSANVTPLVTPSGDQRTLRVGQLGLALSLFVAPWFIVLANAGDSLMTMDGGDGLTPARPSRRRPPTRSSNVGPTSRPCWDLSSWCRQLSD